MAGIFVHFDRLNRLKLHRRLKTSNRAYMYVRNERKTDPGIMKVYFEQTMSPWRS